MSPEQIEAAQASVNSIVPMVASIFGLNIETIFSIFYTLAITGMFVFMVTTLMSYGKPRRL